MIRRVTVRSLSLGLAMIATACTWGTEPNAIRADILTGSLEASILPTSWTACGTGGGCRFNGDGQNLGPDCALTVEGVMWFLDVGGNQVLDAQRQPVAYSWHHTSKAGERLGPGETFIWVTDTRVPRSVMEQARSYIATTSSATVRYC